MCFVALFPLGVNRLGNRAFFILATQGIWPFLKTVSIGFWKFLLVSIMLYDIAFVKFFLRRNSILSLSMPRVSKANLPSLNLGNGTIGQRIVRIRKERGYTQKELANKIGIDRQVISSYETGKLRLYDEMVTRVAIALGVTTDEVLGLNNKVHIQTKPSLRLMRRILKFEELPPSHKKALLRTIDAFLKGSEK